MIAYLSGKIIEINESKIILFVNGVGYEVTVCESVLKNFSLNSEVNLYISSEIREDAFDLFGFLTLDEKSFFKKLRSVSGIGPKTAINLMSIPIEDLRLAVEKEDIKKLTSVNGLGKKTAERMILELKNKLPDSINTQSPHRNLDETAISALKNLGYKNSEINFVLSSMPSEILNTEEVIKFFLKNV